MSREMAALVAGAVVVYAVEKAHAICSAAVQAYGREMSWQRMSWQGGVLSAHSYPLHPG